jgi:phosphoglycolate phosphatase
MSAAVPPARVHEARFGLPRVDSIVFDLDGTLWDTCPACAVAWNRVRDRNRISFRDVTADDVRSVAGKPHEDCIRTVYQGLDEAEVQVLIDQTRTEDIRLIRELGGRLYPGVAEGLRRLQSHFPLLVVSNCQSGYVELFLDTTDLADCFRDHECWGNTGLPKAANLARVIERNQLQAAIFVGDGEGDEEAARACEVPFIHAAYGFGRASAPLAAIGSFDELIDALWT